MVEKVIRQEVNRKIMKILLREKLPDTLQSIQLRYRVIDLEDEYLIKQES